MKNKYRIGKSFIAITNQEKVQQRIVNAISGKLNTYICVSNVRTVLYANKHSDYEEVMKNSYMNIPDGMPLIWAARLWGIKNAKRTMGPELFESMLSNPQSGIKHFLLGDTRDTLHKITVTFISRYNSLIVDFFSPPFCELEEYDCSQIAKQINASGADIVWLSLRSPKQDFLAAKLLPYLENKIVIGVGAAFRNSLGLQNVPNRLMQKAGLGSFFWRKVDAGYFWRFTTRLVIPYIPLLLGVLWRRISGRAYYQ